MPIVGISSDSADPRRDRGRHCLEHDGERTCILQRERVLVQLQRRVGGAALCAEAAELRRRLRRQPDVRHHADVRLGDRADARHHPSGALELDQVGAAFLDEPDRARDRLLVGDLVRAEGHVADHERSPRRAGDGARQEDHLVQGDGDRRLVPEHHLGRAVADQDQLDARLVREQRRGSVVGGEHHDLLAAPLHLDQLGQRQLPGRGRGGSGVAGTRAHSWTLSISRVEPIRAATASVSPSRSATAT